MATDLDPVALRRELIRPDFLYQRIDVVAETGSTNADLAARARAGEPMGSVLISEYQSAGRGRQGRTWTAPRGTSLATSVLLRPAVDPGRWTWLPLLAGLAICEGLRQAVWDLPTVVKWPNDVLVGERKLCGVLAERVDTPTGPACVLGFGLNVSLTEEQLPVPTATSVALALAELGGSGLDLADLALSRTTLLTHILVSLDRVLDHWAMVDDAAMAVAYLERCVTVGRRVRVMLSDGGEVEGVAESIDRDGRLVVASGGERQTFGAGDVVHLR